MSKCHKTVFLSLFTTSASTDRKTSKQTFLMKTAEMKICSHIPGG